jgi:hypothetical protein
VPRALSTVLVALALLVAACGSDDPKAAPSPPPPAADAALPAVSGAPGAAPTLGKPAGAPPAKLTTKVIKEGDGPAAGKGDLVVMNYVGQVWTADKPFATSFGPGQVPVAIPVGAGQTFAGLDTGLLGKKVGSRVLLALPPDQGFGPQGNEQGGHQGHRHDPVRGRRPRALRRQGVGEGAGADRQAGASDGVGRCRAEAHDQGAGDRASRRRWSPRPRSRGTGPPSARASCSSRTTSA